MGKIYFARIEWASEYDDWTEKVNQCFVIADSYSDAASKVADDFNEYDITKLEIELINYESCNVIYVPDDPHLIQAIKDENNY